MKKRRITCEFDYIKSDHLQQIYTGFEMLAKKSGT